MSKITVRFLDKEYIIPSDVVEYVDLIEFTNSVRDNLMRIFTRKIGNIEAIENSNFMMEDINTEVSKFISRLLENDIYDKTANDYLKNNRGIDLFLDTKKKALRQVVSIRQEKLDVYSSGVHDAISKKEASVTGLEFGVLTSSFTNAMIYAFMDASKETEQEKAALKVYNREIEELNKSVKWYDEQEREYIINNFIPAMETVFTYLSYELLDRFVADLIRVGKFDKDALKFVDLERSNDLLKNLELSKNKQAVIEQAFISCPFNIAVYMNAMKYEFLDSESFKTAEYFKQSKIILDFLKDHLGEANYPNYKKGNYYSAVLLREYTGKSVEEILFNHTSSYSDAVLNEYRKLVNLLNNPSECDRVVRHWEDDDILAGEKISRQFAEASVGTIVDDNAWKSITEECGHGDLLDKLLELIPDAEGVHTKADFDKYLREGLYVVLEKTRTEQSKGIIAKREREELQRQKIEKEKRKKNLKTIIVCSIIAVLVIWVISFPTLMDNIKTSKEERGVESAIEKIVLDLEQRIEEQINDDIIIEYDYSETEDWDQEVWYDWNMIVRMNMLEDYRQSGSTNNDTLCEIMDNCRIILDEFNAIEDDLDFWIEVGEASVRLNYEWGVIRFSDISSSEIFYYEETGIDRSLYSGDTEYIIDYFEENEDSSEDKDEEISNQKDIVTKENIAHATALLGKDIDEEGTVNLSDNDYEFVTNDVKMFGANGRVEAGTSDVGEKLHKIDIIDWTSNVEIEELDTLIDVLKDYYGTIYVVKSYDDYSDSAYMWKDVDSFSYVVCWKNSNGTVTIRWMIDLETEK